MKNKGFLLFWVDLLSLVSLFGLLGTGSILEWILPHGGQGGRHGQRARDALWLGISRHDWGEIHFWISVAFTSLILLHLLLHFGWIRSAVTKYLGIKWMLSYMHRSRGNRVHA